MKLKNITKSTKELRDLKGKIITVGSGQLIEIDRATYNKNAFKLILNRKNSIKTIRRLKNNDTSKRTRRMD